MAVQQPRQLSPVADALFTAALIVGGISGFGFFTVGSLSAARPLAPPAVYAPPAPVVPETKPVPTTLAKSQPIRLRIPKIGVNTELVTVGRNSDETMQVPLNTDLAAWYKFSPTPGELGPAIIVGHVDSLTGPAVFWRLGELKQGQIIEITRKDGNVARFKVDTVKQFEQSRFPTERVYGNIKHAGLRLITCGGTFNEATGHYSHNTVVYATLIRPSSD